MMLSTGAQSGFAINLADALSWHHASQLQAQIAERAGYHVRATKQIGWEVWATDLDFGNLVIQASE